MLQAVIYVLCLVTSGACALLLLRSYGRTRSQLLLWSALCFALLSLNNLLVVVDLLVLPSVDLVPLRHLTSLAAVSVLLYGFIWKVQ